MGTLRSDKIKNQCPTFASECRRNFNHHIARSFPIVITVSNIVSCSIFTHMRMRTCMIDCDVLANNSFVANRFQRFRVNPSQCIRFRHSIQLVAVVANADTAIIGHIIRFTQKSIEIRLPSKTYANIVFLVWSRGQLISNLDLFLLPLENCFTRIRKPSGTEFRYDNSICSHVLLIRVTFQCPTTVSDLTKSWSFYWFPIITIFMDVNTHFSIVDVITM